MAQKTSQISGLVQGIKLSFFYVSKGVLHNILEISKELFKVFGTGCNGDVAEKLRNGIKNFKAAKRFP